MKQELTLKINVCCEDMEAHITEQLSDMSFNAFDDGALYVRVGLETYKFCPFCGKRTDKGIGVELTRVDS